MADEDGSKDIHLLKRTKISVYVDEALPDILVVTFEFGLKIFKGVLLDSTKKNIPCGIPNINPAFNVPIKSNADDDALYSVNQRFAYTDPANAKKKNVHISTKYKNNKMTVRLRPRQVLCTKCKGICNENSENVTRKRKPSETPANAAPPPVKRGANAPVTRSVNTELNRKKLEVKRRTLIPKAMPEVSSNALSGNVNKLNIDNNKRRPIGSSQLRLNVCGDRSSSDGSSGDGRNRTRRGKKRSVCSSDELSEGDSSNGPGSRGDEQPLGGGTCTSTRTIKICYGPQGEGTVLKIPAQIENLNVDDDEDDDLSENANVDGVREKDSLRAARKAMKKARKEAKRKTVTTTNLPERTSPRYTVGASSPRYTVGSASPRHGLGNNSPRYITSALEPNTPKKRKHKMKHKKKCREDKDRKHKEDEVAMTQEEVSKEQCLTQKLSINLKRLSTSYTSCQYTTDKTEESSSDEHCEQVPVFPPANPPLMLRINAPTLTSAPGSDGVRLIVGDIVWGKMAGFPWWPGRVLTITQCDNAPGPQARVAWYGCSNESRMQCDQLSPYLDNFKVRYNKKLKRGHYKEAVRQATTDARFNAERTAPPVAKSPARSIIVVPPALASPREINVVS